MAHSLVLRILTLTAVAALTVLPAPGAQALRIIGEFLEKPGPPPGESFGSGNVQDIFDAAAGLWERAIGDDHTVTIHYTWGNIGNDLLGLAAPGSLEARATIGFINFSNTAGFPWYFDPTPNDDSEFGNFFRSFGLFGGDDGRLNTGREFRSASGDASGVFDFFSVALHEIGHILGIVGLTIPFANETLDGDIDIMDPLPSAGAALPTTPEGGGHLDLAEPIMAPFVVFSSRRLLSEVDVLAVAQINGYTQVNLDPARVPEPGALLLWLAGGGALLLARGRN